MALFALRINTLLALQAWESGGGVVTPPVITPTLGASVDAQRVATVTPSSLDPTAYEYQSRPAPTINAQRVADLTSTLAPGETAADYEYQAR